MIAQLFASSNNVFIASQLCDNVYDLKRRA